MDFIEERTPRGYTLKIFYEKGKYLAFDARGKSVYADDENKNLIHLSLLLIFLGEEISFNRDYEKNYTLLKIQNGKIIIPFFIKTRNDVQYIFIPFTSRLDLIPVRMMQINNIADMVRELDINVRPDFIFIDGKITSNDIIIVKNRYKIEESRVIPVRDFLSTTETPPPADYEEKSVNLNMLSQNPVYLARIHLRAMDLSKISQLLLDFELTALDTEYILNFIRETLAELGEDPLTFKNRVMLQSLVDLYSFYLCLLQKNDSDIRKTIGSMANMTQMTAYRTLISKVKSIYPGTDEQILYTEYENIVMDRGDELKTQEKDQ